MLARLEKAAGAAVVGVNGPKDYKYMKAIRFVLRIVSGWPGKALGEKTLVFEGRGHAYYNTIVCFAYWVGEIAYLKKFKHRYEFLELGQLYIVILMNTLSGSRACTLCLSQKYRRVARIFIQEIHLFYFKNKSDFAMKIHVTVHLLSFLSMIYLTFMLVVACVMFNMIPMYANYSSGKFLDLHNTTYEQAVYCLYPWNYETSLSGYIVAMLLGWYGSVLGGSSVAMFDLFLCLIIYNLWGHFKILINNLENFPRPAAEVVEAPGEERSGMRIGSEMYSQSELDEVAGLLKDAIQYHNLIVDFTNKMSDAFGMALFTYYTFHQIAGCLLLLECSTMTAEALTRYLPLTVVMFGELILLSMIFETIGTMSEKLKDAVYDLPWEYMDTKNRKTVLIFLIRVQKPIHVKAGGVMDVGVTTMASILKTSFSYFAFLRTFDY
ncbi:hypothetical protein PYW08_001721 [Mythimna loreyi]|uniref:Uncharacterized protein n=1 Tax=Mythimna loreyi TaxID=667449 RepID=A0ACC2R5F5_9NEOP|nr:hypothetical protein PYW08_001721 [Mythimna loreyi]